MSETPSDRSPPEALLDLAPDALAVHLEREGIEPRTWSALFSGLERLAIDDLPRAVSLSDAVVRGADAAGTSSVRAHARRARAHALAYANRLDEAHGCLSEAMTLLAPEDEGIVGHVQLARLHVLNRLGRSEEAVEAGAIALAAFRGIHDEGMAARAEANLGVVQRMRGEQERALEHFERARVVLGTNPVAAAQLDSNRAEALLELNRFAEAEARFREALAAFREAGLGQAIGIVEGNLGDLSAREGRLRSSLAHFEEARQARDEDAAPGDLARLEAEEAEVLLDLGAVDSACRALTGAIERLDRHGLAWEAARARLALASGLLRARRLDDCSTVIDEVTAAAAALPSPELGASALRLGGELDLLRGEHASAAVRLDRALALQMDRPLERCRSRLAAARLAASVRDADTAAEHLADAGAILAQYPVTPLEVERNIIEGSIARAHGETLAAIAHWRRAVAGIERVRGSLQAERLRITFAEDKQPVYERLVAALCETAGDEATPEAFHTMEQARSRAILDLMGGALERLPDASSDGASALVAQAIELRRELNALYSRLLETAHAGAGSGTGATAPLEVIEAREQELERVERRLSAAQDLGSLFAPARTLAEVQSELDAETTLVAYAFIEGALHAFVVTRDDAEFVDLGCDRDAIDALIEGVDFQLRRALTYASDSPWLASEDSPLVVEAKDALARLYDAVVRPIEASVVERACLHVVPHGPLHAVPFHALWDEERYLGERVRITTTPSASLLGHLRVARIDPSTARALVYGVGDELAPCIADEIDAVAACLPEAIVRRDEEARAERLLEEADDATIVHLVAHGRHDVARPDQTGIRLADRWLFARDACQLRLAGSLVVLSGCETAAAHADASDEREGLARGFFAAGAACVVTSLWPVHDEATVEFMRTLYRTLTADGGEPVDHAWREAQVASRQRWPHPAFWAPFGIVTRPGGQSG